MQAAKKAVETVKETAANIGASAKSGLEKTKATVQEKTERMTAHDPVQKEMATEKKEERIQQAEQDKQEARMHNAAAKQSSTAGHMDQPRYASSGPTMYSTTGDGHPMGASHVSTMPTHAHGPGQVHGLGDGELNEEMMGLHPSGANTNMGRTTARNAHMGGTTPGTGPDLI